MQLPLESRGLPHCTPFFGDSCASNRNEHSLLSRLFDTRLRTEAFLCFSHRGIPCPLTPFSELKTQILHMHSSGGSGRETRMPPPTSQAVVPPALSSHPPALGLLLLRQKDVCFTSRVPCFPYQCVSLSSGKFQYCRHKNLDTKGRKVEAGLFLREGCFPQPQKLERNARAVPWC